MLASISIPVYNVAGVRALGFTEIEISRSEDSGNSWNQVTAHAPQPAAALSTEAHTTWAIGGFYLRVSLTGVLHDITFSDTVKYWSPQMVADRINQVVPGLATVVGVCVQLSGSLTGRGQFLEILASPPGLFTIGRTHGVDGNLLLDDNVLYVYTDLGASEPSDRYRWRFVTGGAGPYSDYSQPVRPLPITLDPSRVSLGYMNFVGVDGNPSKGRLIVASSGPPMQGSLVRYAPATVVYEAGDDGILQVPLLRQAHVKIAVEGTSLVREIVVPNTPSFDIATAIGAAPDELTVQTVPPLATRRSL